MNEGNGNIRLAVTVFLIMATLAHAGKADIEILELNSKQYCESVRDGVHPDYKQTFGKECK